MTPAEFDRFASSYDQDLAKSLAITGEGRDFYARGRIDWTAQCVAGIGCEVQRILDYGCGDGANAPMLAAKFKADQVLGVDISSASIALARQSNYGAGVSFLCADAWTPDGTADLAFCNGVFHHIPPRERHDCLVAIRRALRPGGWFAFWENNPWNLGTRYVMSQCAFDENAIPISPREARKILSDAGFKILRMDSLFYFPRQLRWLRPAERWFRNLPFGGQYLALCQSSDAPETA
ncbi:MAG: class I SAM-dependent methyltransferase [Terriglobales bacterium]